MKKKLNNVAPEFPKRLKMLMIENDKSNAGIASLLDVSEKTVSDYLCGSHSPSLASVVRLADYFDVTVDFLLGRDGKVIFVMK